MKKTFRIILPILLAVVILLSTAWYFFVYDRELTRDLFLQGARYFAAQGTLDTAAWFYDAAYEMVSDNDAVAIELAQQYLDDGNYTKAENVLSSALADGGGSDLYIALCKTYIEQDKLLDAVRLLDNIQNPDIKETLSVLRPSAPVVTPEPGFYTQYISVTFISPEGCQLYVNPQGEFPSIETDLCTQPVKLPAGESTLYALAVAENGLVSPLSVYSYTIGGVIEKVDFQDAAVEAALRAQLGLQPDDDVYTDMLWTVTEFTVPKEAATFQDLAYLTYLESLTIDSGASGQLEILSQLQKLISLSITNTSVSASELTIIGGLTKLQTLVLSNCRLTTTAGLESLTGLVHLDLSGNTIRNIQALNGMTKLQELHLAENALVDLNALSKLKDIRVLSIQENIIKDLTPVWNMTALEWINLSGNKVQNISGVSKLSNLVAFIANDNLIADISGLAECPHLQEVNIANNSVVDLSALSGIVSLSYLDFSHNQVEELPVFPENSRLVSINGSYNKIKALDALAGLTMLNIVNMDYNEELESVEPLATCHKLIVVNVYGTKVTEVQMLTDMSVIVNYDPTLANDD